MYLSLPVHPGQRLTVRVLTLAALVFLVMLTTRIRAPYFPQAGGQSSRLIAGKPNSATGSQLAEAYGKLPLQFEANRGQADASIKFISRGSGYTVSLKPTEAVLAIQQSRASQSGYTITRPAMEGTVLQMQMVGATADAHVEGLEELPGKVHYFVGSDPRKWRTDVPTYAKVRYEDVYPGVDLLYYGNQRQLEYDFVVAPGADPRAILLAFKGADKVEANPTGDLVLRTPSGSIHQQKPHVYQEVNGIRRDLPGRYVLRGNRVGFKLGRYDTSRPLVIDPILSYSTYLGGANGDFGFAIAMDRSGHAFVTGATTPARSGLRNFPTTRSAYDGTFNSGISDVFVAKFNAGGTALEYSTFLGGNGFLGGDDFERGTDIAVDSNGNAYVTGETDARNFPTTPGAYDRTFNGGATDAFITKLNARGSALLYSTYLGGSGNEFGAGIALNSRGSAFVAGYAYSRNFPTTAGAYDRTYNGGTSDAFATRLSVTGRSLVYSTYLGGSRGDGANGMTLDRYGNAYIVGDGNSTNYPTTRGAYDRTYNGGASDAFVSKLSSRGSALAYSTYLGGRGDDPGLRIAASPSGAAYVTGETNSTNFPTTPGAYDRSYNGGSDGFATKLNVRGAGLVYSTFLGGRGKDSGFGIAINPRGNAFVTGPTASTNFPTTRGALDRSFNGGQFFDAYVTKLSTTGRSLVYSSYLGGGSADPLEGDDLGYDIAVRSSRDPQQTYFEEIYVSGATNSMNFPTTRGAFDRSYNDGTDAFVTKIR